MKTDTAPTAFQVNPFLKSYGFEAVSCIDIDAGKVLVAGLHVPPKGAKHLSKSFVRTSVASGFRNADQAREWIARKLGQAALALIVTTDRACMITDDRQLFR